MLQIQPRDLRPTYGWVIVVIAAMAMVATLPGRTHGLGMISERLLTDPAFQGDDGGAMDRVTYSDMNLWGTLLGALFCLPCGRLIDRFGLRAMLTGTVAALAVVVLWMTQVSGKLPLFVGIVFTRGFGQSALSVVSITMVGKWYRGRLGPPMAAYSLLLSLGFVGAARGAKPFALDDWRVVWGGMGWILLAGMLPLAWLLTREPRYEAPEEPEKTRRAESGYTLAQALRTPAFWVFGLAISVVAVISSGQSLFNESVLKEQGFKADVYYDVMAVSGTSGMLVMLPVGWMLRWCGLGRMQAAGLSIMGCCLCWLPTIHVEWQLSIYAILMGMSGTTMTVLFFAVWGQAFGRAHLGEIQGVAQMLTVLASASGPKALAECLARSGSYAPVFLGLAGAAVVLAAASLMVRIPRPDEAPVARDATRTVLALQET
jgi:MFS family permease